MKNKKYTTMRTFKSILLAGTMLLATPAFFSSCQENAPELDYEMKVTVVNDFTKVVEAINQSNISNEQAIKKITAAIDNMKGDQTDKLQAIVAALTSVNNTLETQLNVLAAAMQSMNLELPAKVELISTAVKNRPNYNDKLEAVKTAFENINPNSQLETLNTLLDKYGKNFADKLSAISGWFMVVGNGNGSLDLIKTAIESLGGYGGKLDAINTQMKALLQALESGNISDKEAMAEVANKIKELELNAGVGVPKETMEYVDLGLPSGIKWAKCDLGETVPEACGLSFSWGETWYKSQAFEDSYYFNNGKWGEFFKYNTAGANPVTLDKEDDVAFLRLGEGWRIPTWADVLELYENCTITEASLNGVLGVMFISKKNNNYIFLAYNKLSGGHSIIIKRWTNTLSNDNAAFAAILALKKSDNGSVGMADDTYNKRYAILPIRPVYLK